MKDQVKKAYAGADVSKDKTDVFHPMWDAPQGFENTPAGLRKMTASLAHEDGAAHLIVEATGGYERPVVEACHKFGLIVSVVNPRQARDFAKAKGIQAKTDSVDARMLAGFGEAIQPRETLPVSPTRAELCEVSRRRTALMEQLTRERTRLSKSRNAFVRKDIGSMIQLLERRVEKISRHIAGLIRADEEMAAQSLRLETVVGVGPVLTATVLAEMPELGSLSDKEAASLAGLAPFARDSGKWEGRRRVSGGRGRLRRAMFMPAMCAASHNPILKAFYDRLVDRGKPHHVAITAVMRKLLVLLNRMLADPSFKPA